MTKKLEWNHRDKSAWGDGPWQKEPDKVQWVDQKTGLDCLLHRSPLGAWCGYVGVAEGHPAFGQKYDRVDVEVHGGLTYSSFCQEVEHESRGVCHIPLPGRPEKVWWLGFDCAHYGDFCPVYDGKSSKDRGLPESYYSQKTYRDRSYARKETQKLARQLRAMAE